MKDFELIRDFYDEEILYKKKKITLKPGITILVGCNGVGKTTLLRQIKKQLEKENENIISFDNLRDGGSKARDKYAFYGQMEKVATSMCSSEGENIVLNLGTFANEIGRFVRNFKNDNNDIWILCDAIDSGLSVDNIIDVKEYLFKTIIDDNKTKNVYIVVSANEYELARGEKCFDVYNGKYIKFKDYEEYRTFILKSKEEKNIRIDKGIEKRKATNKRRKS